MTRSTLPNCRFDGTARFVSSPFGLPLPARLWRSLASTNRINAFTRCPNLYDRPLAAPSASLPFWLTVSGLPLSGHQAQCAVGILHQRVYPNTSPDLLLLPTTGCATLVTLPATDQRLKSATICQVRLFP